MAPHYWLFKSEPSTYSFDDFVRDGVAEWDGVRNYQARNYLRDTIQKGDKVFFYHSNAKPMAIIGTALVVGNGYPDSTAWDPYSEHPDPKSTPSNPIWYMVDIQPISRFANPITLDTLKIIPALACMTLLKRGMRLSVQPVTAEEWQTICALGDMIII